MVCLNRSILKGMIIYFLLIYSAVQKRKKEEKFTKSNNVDQVCQDNNVFTNMKESLFQRYSSREVKSADKPVSIVKILYNIYYIM